MGLDQRCRAPFGFYGLDAVALEEWCIQCVLKLCMHPDRVLPFSANQPPVHMRMCVMMCVCACIVCILIIIPLPHGGVLVLFQHQKHQRELAPPRPRLVGGVC